MSDTFSSYFMPDSTITTASSITVVEEIPIFLRRFKNLDNLLVNTMATYALPESHKGVSRSVSCTLPDG